MTNPKINVREFIQNNYTPYYTEPTFLQKPTKKTLKLWNKCLKLLNKEFKKGGVLDVDTKNISGITSFKPGYIDKKNELIVGLQTDKPLKRIVNLYGGLRTAKQCLDAYGYNFDKKTLKHFEQYRKTHNDGVFDAYPSDVRACRSAGLLTGLPDAYGRGRIIGDYRRVPLYGTKYLIKQKKKELMQLEGAMDDYKIRLREEISMQIKALTQMTEMAKSYNIDISEPALNAQQAIQNLYMAYLAGIKENNGAATSLGRVSTFLDIYIERDIAKGILTESQAQELIDQFIIKLRLVRHLRTPAYNEIFGGDPTWVTEAIGGMSETGLTLVTKTSYRFLQTLYNLGSAPEPNLTILWSEQLPKAFKEFCAKVSIDTDSIQYENDDLMRPIYGDDYSIACCVSAMKTGQQMQFFGARCNLAKSLLYAINAGIDEKSGKQVLKDIPYLKNPDDILSYDEVWKNYKRVLSQVAEIYVKANNVIHYMHDKYAYEASQMALHDTDPEPLMAFGIAGLSVAVDSLSAIKFAKVKPIRENPYEVTQSFKITGDYPSYGNDNLKVDSIAKDIVEYFISELNKHNLYKNAKHTLSVLTITSNVMYGEKTGATPDGREAGVPFAPGANPMHGRDTEGALASLNSVAKIPYKDVCQDGVSNTFTITPNGLGYQEKTQIDTLIAILDGYFSQGAQHLNVNVLNQKTLQDAFEHPEKYPTLTIRVSGYAVRFNQLTDKQKLEVMQRTFHERI